MLKRVRGPHGLSVLPLVACASFWHVRRLRIHFESMCEKYGSFNTSDCQSCLSSMTLRASRLAVLIAPQIGETIFMPAGSKEYLVWLKNFFGLDGVLPGEMVRSASQFSGAACPAVLVQWRRPRESPVRQRTLSRS